MVGLEFVEQPLIVGDQHDPELGSIDPDLAAMTTVPVAVAVTSPAALTEAMASFEDVQTNEALGIVAPLEPYAAARSWSRPPTWSEPVGGVTTIAAGVAVAG